MRLIEVTAVTCANYISETVQD